MLTFKPSKIKPRQGAFFLSLILLLALSPATAAGKIKTKTFKNVAWVKCYDGDTCRFDFLDVSPRMFGHALPVRLVGFDTAEIGRNAKCGAEKSRGEVQRDILNSLMAQANKIMIKAHIKRNKKGGVIFARDKFGRILGEVYINGKSVARLMVKKAGARKYNGSGRRRGWCR